MTPLATPIVDLHALGQLVYVSLIAGVGICVVYAIAVLSITRSSEHRRAGRRRPAARHAAIAAIAVAACGWAAVTAVTIMATK